MFAWTVIFGNLLAALTQSDPDRLRYLGDLDNLNRFCARHKLSSELTLEVNPVAFGLILSPHSPNVTPLAHIPSHHPLASIPCHHLFPPPIRICRSAVTSSRPSRSTMRNLDPPPSPSSHHHSRRRCASFAHPPYTASPGASPPRLPSQPPLFSPQIPPGRSRGQSTSSGCPTCPFTSTSASVSSRQRSSSTRRRLPSSPRSSSACALRFGYTRLQPLPGRALPHLPSPLLLLTVGG